MLPERERMGMFREVFARSILNMDMEPLGARFRTDMTIKQLPGLNLVWARSSPVRASRTRALLSDGQDLLAFQWSASASFGKHLGRDVELACNDGVLISCGDPGIIAHPKPTPIVSLSLPRSALAPMLPDIDRQLARPVPAGSPPLRLLSRYAELLKDDALTAMPEMRGLVVAHVYDLLALALGAAGDVAAFAKGRGVRAAHLHSIKTYVVENLHLDLATETVAARHRLSSRHVQRLFDESGSTFTAFVHEQRLVRARRMLVSAQCRHLRVSEIALSAGFTDLSWFNRLFRRRFGMSPSEMREHSGTSPDAS